MPKASQRELGDFLRSRREKTTSEMAGLASGNRRRTPGLRRSEVAELAGISVDWYVRLEQGRTVSPSIATIDALARVFRLGKAEHAHVRELARNSKRPESSREIVPNAIRRMVEGLDRPAYITGRRLDVLAWNDAAVEVFGDFGAMPENDRNILVYMLTDPSARRLFSSGWSAEAQRIVALFRATHDLWASDPLFIDLVDRLNKGCPEFAVWWETHDIASVVSGEKWLTHPKKDTLHFEYTTFQANDDPALKLVVYTPLERNGARANRASGRKRTIAERRRRDP